MPRLPRNRKFSFNCYCDEHSSSERLGLISLLLGGDLSNISHCITLYESQNSLYSDSSNQLVIILSIGKTGIWWNYCAYTTKQWACMHACMHACLLCVRSCTCVL